MTERHIATDRMVELAQGRLLPADRQQATAHIDTCTQCVAQYARVARLVAVTQTDTMEDVPAHVLGRAQRLMRQRTPAAPTLRQRIAAALTFDSRLAPVALGMRSQASATRQILFNAAPYDIDVRVRTNGSRWTIAGQVLGPVTSGTVQLRGAATEQTALNDLGEWTLPPVAAGTYTLVLTLDEQEVAVEIDIGG